MNWASDADYSAPAGMVTIRAGDVIEIDGELMVCDMVNDCRARFRPVLGQTVRVETRFGKQSEFTVDRGSVNIATHVEPESIVERLGEGGLKEFLASQTARRRGAVAGGAEETNDKYERLIIMAAKLRALKGEKKTTKARGGLAADAANAAAETGTSAKRQRTRKVASASPSASGAEPSHSRGKLGQLLGFSVVSVIQRLGKEGVNIAHAQAIVKAQGIPAKPATVAQNVRLGKNGKGKSVAPLTEEQLKGLIASAPAPVVAKGEDVKSKSPTCVG